MDKIKVKVIEEKPREVDESLDELDGVEFNRNDVGNLVSQVGRLYFNVLTLPINILPRRTRYHAKNSLREGLLSLKSLVEEVGESIDQTLNRSIERDKAHIEDADNIIEDFKK